MLNKNHGPIKKRTISLIVIGFLTCFFPIIPSLCSFFFPEIKVSYDVNFMQKSCLPFSVSFFIVFIFYCNFMRKKTKTAMDLLCLDFIMLLYWSAWWVVFTTTSMLDDFRYISGVYFYIFFFYFLAALAAMLIFIFHTRVVFPQMIKYNKQVWDFDAMLYSDNASVVWKNRGKLDIILGVIFMLVFSGLRLVSFEFDGKFLSIDLDFLTDLIIFSTGNCYFAGSILPIKGFQIYYLKKKLKHATGDMLIKELISSPSRQS